MKTIGQKAEEISLKRIPCLIVLKNGQRISAERIEEVSITIYGTSVGQISLSDGQKIEIGDVADISEMPGPFTAC